MVEKIRNVEQSFGSFTKKTLKSEKHVKELMRRSIFTVKNLSAGHIINKEDIKIMKSEGGLHPRYYEKIVGKKILNDKLAFEKIKKDDIYDYKD